MVDTEENTGWQDVNTVMGGKGIKLGDGWDRVSLDNPRVNAPRPQQVPSTRPEFPGRGP